MHGVPAAQIEQHSPTYVRLTRVHGFLSTHETVTAARCVPIEAVLAGEIHTGEGTPEWQAWVARAAARRAVTGCPDLPPALLEEYVP